MNPIKSFFNRLFNTAQTAKRFAAGKVDRISGNFLGNSNQSANAALRPYIERMRARARELERDDPLTRKYLTLLEDNVIGAKGIALQSKVREIQKNKKGITVVMDDMANGAIETHYGIWGKAKNCDITKKRSLVQLFKLIMRTVARDGELLIEFVYGARANNPYGFAIKLIEADHIDTSYNGTLTNGNTVNMGVETNSDGKAVAIYVLKSHPGDTYAVRGPQDRERVETTNLRHVYKEDRAGQSRGYTWMVGVMITLDQLNQYLKAEVVAARAASSKMGFFETSTPEGWTGPEDGDGVGSIELQPGQVEQLPMGVKYVAADPQHPTAQVKDFIKAMIRVFASGLGVSYTSLSSDLEGVNFTSIRAGLLDEREHFKGIQEWFISEVVEPVFEEWLKTSLTLGAIKADNGQALPLNKFDKFNQPTWIPRRWDWVNPKDDVGANIDAINNGLKTRAEVIAERGGDIEEVFAQAAADNDLAKKYGLTFQTVSGQMVSPGGTTGEPTIAEDGAEDTADVAASKPKDSSAPKEQPKVKKPATAAPTEDVQATALNGAQVSALADLAAQVASGTLPLGTAQAIATAAFPAVDAAIINSIFAPLANFKPTVAEQPTAAAPAIAEPKPADKAA